VIRRDSPQAARRCAALIASMRDVPRLGSPVENHFAILRPDALAVKVPLNRHLDGELQSNRPGQISAAFRNREEAAWRIRLSR
jgi:hypothetical protein